MARQAHDGTPGRHVQRQQLAPHQRHDAVQRGQLAQPLPVDRLGQQGGDVTCAGPAPLAGQQQGAVAQLGQPAAVPAKL
jgi:hypothetical protein